ncbi:MAG: hypothetical protein H7Z21_17050 [Hymenobacter sp.]|nr:hypothetical protein [Hymenobacter sp.]
MPILDTDRLRTYAEYAKTMPNRQGGLGVTVSYLHQVIKAKKLPAGVEPLTIRGIRFIQLPE